jgi:hypothetical protein
MPDKRRAVTVTNREPNEEVDKIGEICDYQLLVRYPL